MRTVIFYSCKGGSGRTLTLANVAALLVRLGYKVLCIDLDLEAPGLFEALGNLESPGSHTSAGFVEYATLWLAQNGHTGGAKRQPETDEVPGAVETIAQADGAAATKLTTNPLQLARQWVVKPGEIPADPQSSRLAKPGSLQLIRAGDYVTANGLKKTEYWDVMRGGLLDSLYPLPGSKRASADDTVVNGEDGSALAAEADTGSAAARDSAVSAEDAGEEDLTTSLEAIYHRFWLDVREQLASEVPGDAPGEPSGQAPDFLLVDTRTGFSPLSTTTIDAFLDELAVPPATHIDLFVFADRGSEASRLGTQEFVRQLRRRHSKTLQPRRLTIVRREQLLTSTVDEPGGREPSPEEWLSAGDDDVSWTAPIDFYKKIRSDPEVERTGMALASPKGELIHRGLLDDYVAITASLLEDSDEQVRLKLGLGTDPPTDFKLFRLPASGGMQNVEDSQPNISFSLPTFRSLATHLATCGVLDENALAKAGRLAGASFAVELKTKTSEEHARALESWRKLDSAVGWGTFALDPKNAREFLAEGERRTIKVFHNAFAPRMLASAQQGAGASSALEPDPGDPGGPGTNLCAFLGGYLTGILSKFMEQTSVTTTPQAHVLCQSKGHAHCEFVFISAKSAGQ